MGLLLLLLGPTFTDPMASFTAVVTGITDRAITSATTSTVTPASAALAPATTTIGTLRTGYPYVQA
jgi:hypothetical protein